jgi:ATP-dependent protease ClpP protease subunit
MAVLNKVNKLVLTAAAVFLFTGVPSFGKSFEFKDPKRTVEVIDVVDGSMLVSVAQKIHTLTRESADPIYLMINSPGGAVLVGTSILDAMKMAQKKGIVIKCAVGTLAASMAFIILAQCDERYVLHDTKLLFHPVSTGGGGRLQELLISMEQTQETEFGIMKFLQETMGLEWRKFHMHYFAETMWSGNGLDKHTKGKFLRVVDSIEGTDKVFVIERPKQMFLFKINAQNQDYQRAYMVLKRMGINYPSNIEKAESEEAK